MPACPAAFSSRLSSAEEKRVVMRRVRSGAAFFFAAWLLVGLFVAALRLFASTCRNSGCFLRRAAAFAADFLAGRLAAAIDFTGEADTALDATFGTAFAATGLMPAATLAPVFVGVRAVAAFADSFSRFAAAGTFASARLSAARIFVVRGPIFFGASGAGFAAAVCSRVSDGARLSATSGSSSSANGSVCVPSVAASRTGGGTKR
ncbi:MAG: hypothetical protein WBD46_13850 [Acidobacteriaceae bacterium]